DARRHDESTGGIRRPGPFPRSAPLPGFGTAPHIRFAPCQMRRAGKGLDWACKSADDRRLTLMSKHSTLKLYKKQERFSRASGTQRSPKAFMNQVLAVLGRRRWPSSAVWS